MANAFMDAVQQGLQVSGILDNMQRSALGDELVKTQLETAKFQYQELQDMSELRKQLLSNQVTASGTEVQNQEILHKILKGTADFEIKTKEIAATAAQTKLWADRWAIQYEQKKRVATDYALEKLISDPNTDDATRRAAIAQKAGLEASIVNAYSSFDEQVIQAKANTEKYYRDAQEAKATAERLRHETKLGAIIGAIETAGKGNIGPMEYLLSSNALELPGAQYNRLATLYTKIKGNPQAYAQRLGDDGVGAALTALAMLGGSTETTTKSVNVSDAGVTTTNQKTTNKTVPPEYKDVVDRVLKGVRGTSYQYSGKTISEMTQRPAPEDIGLSPQNPYIPKDGRDFFQWSNNPANKGKFFRTTNGAVQRNPL